MTTFNDLFNTDSIVDDIHDNNNDNDNDNNNYNVKNNKFMNSIEPLFTIDESIPKDKLPFEGIHYLDNTKIYNQTKPLGEYTLKIHQNTTLHYMIGLENMKYNAKIIKTNNTDKTDKPDKTSTQENIVENIHNIIPNINQVEEITNHYTNIGILSDHVGAGKSYCIMALLNEAKSIIPNEIPFRSNYLGSSNITPKKIKKLDTNILLVPHSLIGQWSKYLEKSGLKYYVVQKAKDVFSLGDKDCKFSNNDIKDDSNNQPIKKKSKRGSKASKIEDTEQNKTELGSEAGPVTKGKKKIVLKTKSICKTTVETVETIEPIASLEVEANIVEANIVEEVTKPSSKTKSDIKKKLELEKIEITREIRDIESQISVLRNHPNYRYPYYNRYNINDGQNIALNNNNNNIEFERQLVQDKINILNTKLSESYKKHSQITESIKNTSLLNGNITDGQIQSLHTYNIICNNSSAYAAPSNYICDSLKEFYSNFSHINKPFVESFDVILVSETFYNLFSLYVTRDNYTVNRIIIDECNSVKGVQLLNINTIFTWLITSSINSLMTENGWIIKKLPNPPHYTTRVKSIMSTGFILNTICKLFESKDNLKLFLINNPEYIKQSILLPEMKTFVIICKDNVIIQVLNGIVTNEIMRMLNAGDIEGIINKLDVVVGDENNIVSIVTQKYTEELLIKEYELKVAIENPKYKPDTESLGITNKRIIINDLKHKIACIEERIKSVDSCPICIDDLVNPIITPCCNNKYCFNCITICLNNKANCPSCRSVLSVSKLMVLDNKVKKNIIDDNSQNIKDSKLNKTNILQTYSEKTEYLKSISLQFTKYENMDKIFELNNDNPIKKYLIFTEYESTLNTKITSILNKWNLKYDRIRGSSVTINKQLEKYKKQIGNSDETNVLLVNSKFFGSGMNLENTTDIIIMHKMQSDIEMQAIGRAQRFGRVGELRVWKLYYQNESL